MFNFQTSIRQKTIFAYYVGVAVIASLFIFAFFTCRLIQKKILFGEVISELVETTLEIRRFEKNYFLYEQESDFHTNIDYTKKAQDILDRTIENYRSLTIYPQLKIMKEDLQRYSELMKQFATMKGKNSAEKQLQEETIRETGKRIVTIAENISKTEIEIIKSFLRNMMINLIFAIILLSLGGIAIGHILSRMVVKPLKSLEDKMRHIAAGKLEKVAIDSKDREIVSLTNAFNKMLTELNLKQKHLVQSAKLASLGTLLSGVAHELNNPLSNISTSCQILIEDFDDIDGEHKKELLLQIDQQTERARNIVRALLEYSRYSEFKKEPLQLNSLLQETIQFIRGEKYAGVQINLEVPAGITVFADKQRIQQVFLNLIKNGIDSISGEGTVFIRARECLHTNTKKLCDYTKYCGTCTGDCLLEKDTIDIEIEDTGSGIPPEVITKIFDPFFTTKDTGKTSERGLFVGKGSGLGLYIVEEIINEHGGCIAVDSTVGKGTCFLIRLPLKE